ncbi:hypothetical protein Hdeb2414_s0076g00776871 [Helianthus debilis subsp. tardiflorus]
MDSQDQDINFTSLLSQDPQLGSTYGGQSGTSLAIKQNSNETMSGS